MDSSFYGVFGSQGHAPGSGRPISSPDRAAKSKFFTSLGLRHLLAIAFVLIAAVPAVLYGAWVERTAFENEKAAVHEKHLLIATNLTTGLQRFAHDAMAVFEYLSSPEQMTKPNPNGLELANSVGFRHLCIVGPGGEYRGHWELEEPYRQPISQSILPPLLGAAGDTASFSDIMHDGVGIPTIFITKRLPNGDVAIGALDLDYIRRLQSEIAFGENGHSAIVDRRGNVIAHPRKDWESEIKNISKVAPVSYMMSGLTGVTTFYSPAAKMEMISGYTMIPETGWGVMVPQPLVELEARADEVRRVAGVVVLVGLLVAGLIGWFLSGLLVRPVKAVVAAARELATGNLAARIPAQSLSGPSELRELGQSFNAMAQDIETAVETRNAAEAERLFALYEAQQASRAKSDFLASMSHELRTPLNAICGFSEILAKELFGRIGSPKYKEYAQDIKSSSAHLLDLVNDILDISAIEAGKQPLLKTFFPVDGLIGECATIIRPAAEGKRIQFDWSTETPISPVYADKRALKQILLNLLSNAVKFTPEGGWVYVVARQTMDGHEFTIADDGCGVAKSKVPHLTDAFVQANEDPFTAQGGTGLGLSIVKTLVDHHDGRLTIDSTVDVGTTVRVFLPASDKQGSSDDAHL